MSNKYGVLKQGDATLFPICKVKKELPESTITAIANTYTALTYTGNGNIWTAGTWEQKGVVLNTDTPLIKIVVPVGETWFVKLSATCGTVYMSGADKWPTIGICEVNSSRTVLKSFGTSLVCDSAAANWACLSMETIQEFGPGTHYVCTYVKTSGEQRYYSSPTLTSTPNANNASTYQLGPAALLTAQIVERRKD